MGLLNLLKKQEKEWKELLERWPRVEPGETEIWLHQVNSIIKLHLDDPEFRKAFIEKIAEREFRNVGIKGEQ